MKLEKKSRKVCTRRPITWMLGNRIPTKCKFVELSIEYDMTDL